MKVLFHNKAFKNDDDVSENKELGDFFTLINMSGIVYVAV